MSPFVSSNDPGEPEVEAVFSDFDIPTPTPADLLAGVSVALVLIPQSLAYASIAGMPPFVGLFASALPLIVFSLFASSPYLQTGPVAMTSLLTLAGLTSAGFVAGTPQFIAAGALLALMVGCVRFLFGLCRLGWVAYLISDPVTIGFTSGAAVIIMASQFPKCVGVSELVPGTGTIQDALWALTSPDKWSLPAIALSLATVLLMVVGRTVHRLFPGVLVAVLIGLFASNWLGYSGPIVGAIPSGMPQLSFALPWHSLPSLVFASLIIAFVGFAEPSAIARVFANEDGEKWNANREFFSSGLANMAAAISGGYPVGGSFSRSSVNRVSGAQTRWSGGITGVCVLCFLSIAWILSKLPLAVLGGIVLAAVYRLTKPRRMVRLWWRSPVQAALAWSIFAATICFTPHIHWAILLGVALSTVLHVLWPLKVRVVQADHRQVRLKPVGLLWFATQTTFRNQLHARAAEYPDKDVVVDLSSLIALDVTTIERIAGLAVAIHPRRVDVADSPWNSNRIVAAAVGRATQGVSTSEIGDSRG